MDKNAIKKFATWARRELISRVSQKAELYGVTAKGYGDFNADSIDGRVLTSTEKDQRKALISLVKKDGFEQAMEEVAYTWFNRFSALRYMEVNNYLPTRVRVFTNESGEFKPQILDEAIHLELDGLDMEKVYALKEANETEALYRYLLITQCNALSKIMPVMFQKISDYTELLLPDYLLREGSVIEQMITMIPESDWDSATLDEDGEPQGQVQIIGWLYQYYNAEKKDEVFAALKNNVKITKENIPAATQLFTPDWIVRYMVENSLGRLWVEGHPNEELKSGWKYYLEEAKQEPDVETQLAEIRKEYAALTPEEILCIDPCAGSGHILDYLFDVLMQIYTDYGYTTSEAVRSIIENNLYGLDIDDRAAQLAYFSVMMKARSYDRRFLTRKDEDGNPDIPQPHVYAIVESNGLNQNEIDYFTNNDPKLKKDFGVLVDELHDAKEYGSILNISQVDFAALYARMDEVRNDISMYKESTLKTILPLIQVAEALAQKYHVVVTNPPYMGGSNMSAKLSNYVKENYPESKSDLFACFMEKADSLTIQNGYTSLITMESWMFLSSFEKLRYYVNRTKTIINMVHMPYLGKGGTSLGINFGTAAVIMKKGSVPNYNAQYEYTVYYECDENGVPFEFPTQNERWKTSRQSNFEKIPGSPIVYWVSKNFLKCFQDECSLDKKFLALHGLLTGHDEGVTFDWPEISYPDLSLNSTSQDDLLFAGKKYVPLSRGGEFRRWYGVGRLVVRYDKWAMEFLKDYPKFTLQNKEFYFKKAISWPLITTRGLSVRMIPDGYIFGNNGPSIFSRSGSFEEVEELLGFLNTKVAYYIETLINPTMSCSAGVMKKIPLVGMDQWNNIEIVRENISISKIDWDSFETSWDFTRHPLVRPVPTLSVIFDAWQSECAARFAQLKANEEELNRIFIDIYGLRDELTPDVEDKDVTVRLADKARDIRSFISYAVGCMFGRYSLDVDGLAYAGGEWDASKYSTYIPDKDGIIPICDDEYFEDDIANRFVDFVRVVYGKETLEENLKFIADALGGKGVPRQVIRDYFMNDFYADHLKVYQKRPIYWLFDSGKKNGFKCLIYIHRYKPDTIARIRTDYVHEQQARYRTAIAGLENQIANAGTGERVKLNKQLKKLQDQADELHGYEEKIHHLADQFISIDLDDGVKHNYEIFKDVLAKIK